MARRCSEIFVGRLVSDSSVLTVLEISYISAVSNLSCTAFASSNSLATKMSSISVVRFSNDKNSSLFTFRTNMSSRSFLIAFEYSGIPYQNPARLTFDFFKSYFQITYYHHPGNPAAIETKGILSNV